MNERGLNVTGVLVDPLHSRSHSALEEWRRMRKQFLPPTPTDVNELSNQPFITWLKPKINFSVQFISFSISQLYFFKIPFLENLGRLFLGKTARAALALYQASVVHSSTYRGVRGFYGFCQGSGERPLLFFDFQLPRNLSHARRADGTRGPTAYRPRPMD